MPRFLTTNCSNNKIRPLHISYFLSPTPSQFRINPENSEQKQPRLFGVMNWLARSLIQFN